MTQGIVRIVALRGVAHVFDDNFQKKWTNTYNTAQLDRSDDDAIEIEIDTGKSDGGIGWPVAFDTTLMARLVIQIDSLTATNVTVEFWLSGAKEADVVFTSTGIGVFNIQSEHIGNIDEIRIIVNGSAGEKAVIDYISVGSALHNIITDTVADFEDEIRVGNVLFNEGMNRASFNINNVDESYDSAYQPSDIILIWMAESGESLVKRFGGRIDKTTLVGGGGTLEVLQVTCLGHEWELFKPESLLQERYAAENGRTIIEEALAKGTIVAEHPSLFFDCHALCDISSTHSAVYDEEQPGGVIKEILDKAKNSNGVQGFDAYFTPSGCMVAHLRNSGSHVHAGTVNLKLFGKDYDSHTVVNKQTVYGRAEKTYPDPYDKHTEQTAGETPADDGWTTDGTLSWTYAGALHGSDCIRATRAAVFGIQVWNSLPGVTSIDISNWKNKSFKKMKFAIKIIAHPDGTPGQNIGFNINCPNAANSYGASEPPPSKFGEWREYEIELGPDNKYHWNPNGSPDWANLQSIRITINSILQGTHTLEIDGFHFGGARFSGEAEDSDSQDARKTRIGKPVVDDNLQSDDECAARADSIIKQQKDMRHNLQDATVDLDFDFTLADKVTTHVSATAFRLTRHSVVMGSGGDLRSEISLNNEPSLVDQVFKQLFEEAKKAHRRVRAT